MKPNASIWHSSYELQTKTRCRRRSIFRQPEEWRMQLNLRCKTGTTLCEAASDSISVGRRGAHRGELRTRCCSLHPSPILHYSKKCELSEFTISPFCVFSFGLLGVLCVPIQHQPAAVLMSSPIPRFPPPPFLAMPQNPKSIFVGPSRALCSCLCHRSCCCC